jgi:hypothetical protein
MVIRERQGNNCDSVADAECFNVRLRAEPPSVPVAVRMRRALKILQRADK